jgi:autotransporter-associated beta strand protein
MYQGGTSLEIHYTGGHLNSVSGGVPVNHAALIDINILGNNIPGMTIDTGSTGIAISAAYLPSLAGYTPLGPGTINYDSSGASPSGMFYELPVSLLGGTSGGAPATGSTTVKVLVVTNDNTTKYFGIGNNRNNVYSGTINPSLSFAQNVAQGNLTQVSAVGMNPLINVSVNGTALPHQGYVVMNDRIVVGLTAANNGYSFVQLTPDPANGPNLWNATPVALSVGGSAYGTGTILHDTGISYAFLHPFGQDGETVNVAMPGASSTGAFYSFAIERSDLQCATTAGNSMTPCYVKGSPSTTPYLNTGRQFFAGLNYLFDPVNGFAGYGLSSSGLTTTATLNPMLALTGTLALSNGFSTDFDTYLMGNTTLTQTGTGTLSGVISGAAGLTIAGGTVNLLGNNTFTGGMTISSGGTLRAAADTAMGALSGGLAFAGGTLQATGAFTIARQVSLEPGGGTVDTNGNNIVVSNAITGSGGLTKAGAGILTVSGANAYAGGTTINAGTLRLASGASLPSTGVLTVNGGTLDFNGNDVTVGALAGAGGTIDLGASTLTVAESGSTTFAGTIAGTGGLTKAGTGLLNLTGTNTYSGPTSITGGRLSVNGTIASDVTVGSGGSLGGSGTINGAVVNNGTLAPGNSIGTVTVNGSYTQAAGSTYQVEANASGQADRINVTGVPGTATINGGTVQVVADPGIYAPSTTYTILNATGGVTGSYAGASSNYPFLQASLAYDPNNIYLTLKPGGFATGAATGNQAAVGAVLDRSVAGSSGDFATVIGAMSTLSAVQGQAAMNAISGQNYSGFSSANVGGALTFMNAVGRQMDAARGGDPGKATRTALAEACGGSEEGACGAGPWSLWATGLAGFGSIAGNANAGAVSYNVGGVATGVDYRAMPTLLLGGGVGFSSGSQWADGFSGRGTTDSYQASLYASFVLNGLWLDGLAGYAWNDNRMQRQIAIPGLPSRIASGATGANQIFGQLEAGYRFGLYTPAGATVAPFARIQGTTAMQNGFTESGAQSLNLTVAPQTTNSVRSTLGAEATAEIPTGATGKLGLLFRVGWVHEYANTDRPVTAAFAGAPGSSFTVLGATPARDMAALSFAANTALADATSLFIRYDGEVGGGSDNHAFTAGLRMTW